MSDQSALDIKEHFEFQSLSPFNVPDDLKKKTDAELISLATLEFDNPLALALAERLHGRIRASKGITEARAILKKLTEVIG
jgi:hypothetical protein